MSKLLSALGHIVVDPSKSEESIERITKYLNNMSDILTMSSAERVEPGSINSESILQNSIDKKHVLNTNSSNLLDNPSFELVGLDKTNEVVKGGAAQFGWDIIDPTDTNTQDVQAGSPSTPYQGRYIARYRNKDQDATATIIGSGDAGIIDKYNDGVIQAQEGELFSFSFYHKYVTSNGLTLGDSGAYKEPDAGQRDKVSGFIDFRDKDGEPITTEPTVAKDSTNEWAEHRTAIVAAPALTAYITAGVKVLEPEGTNTLNMYYFDACNLSSESIVAKPGYLYATLTFPNTGYSGTGVLTTSWVTAVSGWTLEENSSDWSEGAGGDLVYGGDEERLFRVSWNMSVGGGINKTFSRIMGRVTKKPAGGAHAAIAGSTKGGDWDYYSLYIGYYFHLDQVSNEFLVSLAPGDALAFQNGFGWSVFGGGGATAWQVINLATLDGINLTVNSVG